MRRPYLLLPPPAFAGSAMPSPGRLAKAFDPPMKRARVVSHTEDPARLSARTARYLRADPGKSPPAMLSGMAVLKAAS